MRLLTAFVGLCLMFAGPLADTTIAQSCSPDITKPVISGMPADTLLTAEPGVCGATVSWTIPTATDNCELLSFTANAATPGDFFGVGTTMVTYTARDTAGNVKASSFFITITDDEKPAIHNLPTDTTISVISGTCAATYTWTAPTATDNCEVSSIIGSDASGDSFGKGSNTITYTASDVNGNDSIASFIVTVIDDEDPVITNTPSDTTIVTSSTMCGQVVNWVDATATDNCTLTSFVASPANGSTFNAIDSPITVTLTATDQDGNQATSTFVVTIADETAPVITGTPSDMPNVSADNGECYASITWTAPTASDNCAVSDFINDADNDNLYSVGDHTVTFIATDAAGNADTTSFDITVSDLEAPSIAPMVDIAVFTDADSCNAVVTWTTPAISDNCNIENDSLTSDYASGDTFDKGTTLVTYTAIDDYGNSSSTSFSVTVSDNQIPTIVSLPDTTIFTSTGTCAAAYTWTASADDNCEVTSFTSSKPNGFTFNVGETTVTLTAKDAEDNTTTDEFKVTVIDNEKPAIQGLPSDITQSTDLDQCSTNVSWPAITSTDNCAIFSSGAVPASGTPFSVGENTVTYTATDINGNDSIATFKVTITDNQKPAIVDLPNDTTLSASGSTCASAAFSWTEPTSNDNCPGHSISQTAGSTNGATFGLGQNMVTYTASDVNGNDSIASFYVTVSDTTKPLIAQMADITLNTATGTCAQTGNWTAPTVTENCTLDTLYSSPEEGSSFSASGDGETTVTYTALDEAGNSSTMSFTVKVSDTENPNITAASDTTIECDGAGNAADIASWVANNGGATATDNCTDEADIVWTALNEVPVTGTCASENSRLYTFTATDSSENYASTTATLYIVDTTPPSFDTALPGDTLVDCDAVPTAPSITATDSCIGATAVVYLESSSAGICPNAYELTRKWTTEDDCGNQTEHIQVIAVQDTTGPVFDTPPVDVSIEPDGTDQSGEFTSWLDADGSGIASDNCAGTISIVPTYTMGEGCAGDSTTVTFTATDVCGNSTTAKAVWQITDLTPPVIGTPAVNDTVNCDGAGNSTEFQAWVTSKGGASGSDLGGYIEWSNDSATATATPGTCPTVSTTAVEFTVTDSCGNASTTSALFVIIDTIAPAFTSTLPGDTVVNCDAIDTYLPPTLSSMDGCDGDITATFAQTSNAGTCIDNNLLMRTWTATDGCSNAISHTQNVVVQDTTKPNVAAQDFTVYLNASGVAAIVASDVDDNSNDNCTALLSLSVNPSSFACADTAAPVTVTLLGTDDCGNQASATASVTVLDTISPTFASFPNNITENVAPGTCAKTITWTEPTASDNCAATVTREGQAPNTSFNAGTHNIVYTATDESGNAISGTLTITVNDNEAPDIAGLPNDTTINTDAGYCGATFSWTAPTAIDSCPNSTIALDPGSQNAGSFFALEDSPFTVSYTATDAASNTYQTSFQITVQDKENPSIYGLPSDTILYVDNANCTAALNYTPPTTEDNCAGAEITKIAGPNPNEPIAIGTATVTYTASDVAGNDSTASFTIQVVDTISPSILNLRGDSTLYVASNACAASMTWTDPTVSDNCAGSTLSTLPAGSQSGDSFTLGENIISYTATDANTNTSTASFTISVVDTISPSVEGLRGDSTLYVAAGECAATMTWTEPTAEDNCTGASISPMAGASLSGTAFGLGATTVTYTAIDGSSNSDSSQFVITVLDTIAPTLDNMPADIVINPPQGSCDTLVTWIPPTAGDNCAGFISSESDTSGTRFAIGSHYVYYTASDSAGNTTSDSLLITINDNDLDSDNIGDCSDPDIDGDGVLNDDDDDAYDKFVCSDDDDDGCEDCLNGSYDTANDGPDSDSDGICDDSDLCSDPLANNYQAPLTGGANEECQDCPDAPIFDAVNLVSNATTLSSNDGAFSLDLSSGAATLVMLYGQNGASDYTIALPGGLDTIAPGYYSVMVMDDDGCFGVADTSVGGTTLQQPGISRSLVIPFDVCCSGCGIYDLDADGICDEDDNCTNQSATNFADPANEDCIISGCTDTDYIEYNASATNDDGSCSTLIFEGCTNPTAPNYDAAANTDDGSCIIYGCMDQNYIEYNPAANTFNDSCSTLVVEGCTDPDYTEYNASANTDDGSCATLVSTCASPSMDGHSYGVVEIGDQCWFAENLRTTDYADGSAIPEVTDDATWSGLSSGARSDYDNDASNALTYGRLYNWYAVANGSGLCPSGWHVPTDEEWTALETYLGANGHSGTEGTALKSTSGWNSGNGTDDFGFSALPGGFRFSNGNFNNAGFDGYWWSSSPSGGNAWYRNLYYDFPDIFRDDYNPRFGFSVRCLRDAD